MQSRSYAFGVLVLARLLIGCASNDAPPATPDWIGRAEKDGFVVYLHFTRDFERVIEMWPSGHSPPAVDSVPVGTPVFAVFFVSGCAAR
jgi:hypothetical protein